MVKFFFMHFGTWLRNARKAAALSQERLASLAATHGVRVTGAYISNLERGYDTNKAGKPIRPSHELVEALAKALRVPIDDALLAAGYAPVDTPLKESAGFLFRLDADSGWDSLTDAQKEAVRELTLTTIRSLANVSKDLTAIPAGTLKLGRPRKTKTG